MYTYLLPSEKQLYVVIRGLPEPLTEDYIQTELENLEFHPSKIKRLTKGPNRIPMPLVLAILPKNEKHIYQLSRLAEVTITTEPQRQQPRITQCFRCQNFRHSQGRCTAFPKSIKCAGDHHSAQCTKSINEPSQCANCGEAHTASFRGCKAWPKLPQVPQKPRPSTATPETSYAAAVKQVTASSSNLTLMDMFTKFQNMYSQMQDLANQLVNVFNTPTQQ